MEALPGQQMRVVVRPLGRAHTRLTWCWLFASLSMCSAACRDAQQIFTEDRLENLCTGHVPTCGMVASCVLGEDQYIRGQFPGGATVVVRTDERHRPDTPPPGQQAPTEPASEQGPERTTVTANMLVRLLLIDPRYPGTELRSRGYDNDCGNFDERLDQEVPGGLFELAGGDGVIDHALVVGGDGDHMVTIFSDMNAGYLLRVDLD